MKNKLITLGVVVALALASLGLYTQVNDEPLAAQSQQVVDGNRFNVEGVQQYFTRRALAQATTTICAIRSPQATSTLDHASVRFTVSSTTASIITIAKATTAFATTTIIGNQVSIAANAQATIIATTTSAQVTSQTAVFAPNDWLVIGMQGGIGTMSPTGICQAKFTEI